MCTGYVWRLTRTLLFDKEHLVGEEKEIPADRPKRADAQRNIATILHAAARCLAADPDASMADIAAEAGLGRVTVYSHFPSRTELVRAVVENVIRRGEETLEAVDLDGDVQDALVRLIDVSWLLIAELGAIASAAISVLNADEIRRLHDAPAERVGRLVRRGRAEGVFRTDLSESWLVGVLHALMQGAAVEVAAGRLTRETAPDAIGAIALSAYRA